MEQRREVRQEGKEEGRKTSTGGIFLGLEGMILRIRGKVGKEEERNEGCAVLEDLFHALGGKLFWNGKKPRRRRGKNYLYTL